MPVRSLRVIALTPSPLRRQFWRTLAFSQGMALVWWLLVLEIRARDIIPIWFDQQHIFLRSAEFVQTPFAVAGFVNPPWLAVVMIPFATLPLPVAVLAQVAIYFGAITCLVYVLGGNWQAVAIALTSFVALDSTMETGIDWIVIVGLLLPMGWNAPFVFIKPQTALGYFAGVPLRNWLRLILGAAITGILSLVMWGWWLPAILENIRLYTVSATVNLAPMAYLTPFVSLPLGVFLLWQAYRRRDPLIGVLAWLFIVPYIALYSLLVYLALFAVRYPRIALLISVVMWIIYGQFVVLIFTL